MHTIIKIYTVDIHYLSPYFNRSNTTGSTIGTQIAYLSGAHEVASDFRCVRIVYIVQFHISSFLVCVPISYEDVQLIFTRFVVCPCVVICLYLRILESKMISISDDVRIVLQ